MTISVGVAYMPAGVASLDKNVLFSHADAALYEAKDAGRNKVIASDKT
ncbi:MAG: diguanylate cyclase [Bdellovibrionota bacterium]